jgi:hypothetical protein
LLPSKKKVHAGERVNVKHRKETTCLLDTTANLLVGNCTGFSRDLLVPAGDSFSNTHLGDPMRSIGIVHKPRLGAPNAMLEGHIE